MSRHPLAYAYDPTASAIQAALGDDRSAALWAEGRGWSQERAVAYALDDERAMESRA